MSDKRLTIGLTDEQVRLYMESPTFHQGVDAFITGVLPLYLDGLSAKAVATDKDIASRIAAIEQQDTTPMIVVSYYYAECMECGWVGEETEDESIAGQDAKEHSCG